MTRRMRQLRRELALNCVPDARSDRALYWVPLTVRGRIAVRINAVGEMILKYGSDDQLKARL